VSDQEALEAFHLCARLEGILPALETAHAVVEALRIAARKSPDQIVVVCFSGRGDKDCAEVARLCRSSPKLSPELHSKPPPLSVTQQIAHPPS
jgi:tryptophan synthase beta chain